jgi:divalent metal cation (Fe/Co/Zn/Cd) transporter
VSIELDRIMTLDKAHETLTLIRNSVLTNFKAEDVVVISASPYYCKKPCSSI